MRTPKCIWVISILNHVLPGLSTLSKTFQKGTVNFARIRSAIKAAHSGLGNCRDAIRPWRQRWALPMQCESSIHWLSHYQIMPALDTLDRVKLKFWESIIIQHKPSRRSFCSKFILFAYFVRQPFWNSYVNVQTGEQDDVVCSSDDEAGDPAAYREELAETATASDTLRSFNLCPDDGSNVDSNPDYASDFFGNISLKSKSNMKMLSGDLLKMDHILIDHTFHINLSV